MAQGVILSDFHLFTDRCDEDRVKKTLDNIDKNISFLVLNGDIFDFRWSTHPTQKNTLDAATKWLRSLFEKFPASRIYYIMGNHDCSIEWAQALESISSDQFFWSPTHFKIGEALCLHGDLPINGLSPFKRHLPSQHKKMPLFSLMNALYTIIIQTKIHHAASLFCGPRFCVPKIERAIRNFAPPEMHDTKHIYFGHTHAGFNNYHYKDLPVRLK